MKKIFCFALVFLALLLPGLSAVPVQAATDYGMIYDVTSSLDTSTMEGLNQDLTALTDELATEYRIDIVRDLEGESIEKYANIFIEQYEYGYGDTGNLIYLMIYISEEDGSISYLDSYMTASGSDYDDLNIFVHAAQPYLDPFLTADAWSGDTEADLQNLSGLVEELCFDARAVYGSDSENENTTREATSVSDTAGQSTVDAAGTAENFVMPELTVDFVMDEADLLSDSEEEALRSRAKELSETYSCNVYLVSVDDFKDYGSNDVMESAKNIYRTYELGYGSGKDGFLLLLSMKERDWALIAYGDFGNATLTDYGRTDMKNHFLKEFGDDDWYGGFDSYLKDAETYLKMSAAGTPYDIDTDPFVIGMKRIFSFGFAAIVGLIVSLVVTGRMKRELETANAAHSAKAYVVPGKANITSSKDTYLHTTRTRVYDPPSKSSSGGSSGGTSVGSDGFSGSSGKF